MIPAGVIQVRSDICADCPTPCEWQRDAVRHADACSACHIRRWGSWGACKDSVPQDPPPAKMRGLGDAVAAVAQPIARLIDAATGQRTNVAGCSKCKARQAALNKAVPFV